MDPNSAHQLWSRWTAIVTVPFSAIQASQEFRGAMIDTSARFYRGLFGSVSELNVDARQLGPASSEFVVVCRTEGAPAPDAEFRRRRMADISAFFGRNLSRYGDVNVRVDVHVEAGDVGDGKPPAQLILGPPVALMPRMSMLGR